MLEWLCVNPIFNWKSVVEQDGIKALYENTDPLK